MHHAFFRFQLDRRGRVILRGLTPEETFEFEELNNQCEKHLTDGARRRLDELCTRHCASLCR